MRKSIFNSRTIFTRNHTNINPVYFDINRSNLLNDCLQSFVENEILNSKRSAMDCLTIDRILIVAHNTMTIVKIFDAYLS